MDAFYAAVEQRDNPQLRGKPIVVGGDGKRGVVSTASYEARPYGLHSAMPMVDALRKCPDVIVVPPNMAAYQEASDQIMEVFARYSPLVEPLSLDEAFVDMSGATQIFGSPEQMAMGIKREVTEATDLTISVGVSTTKYVAKVASDFRKPDGMTVVPGDQVRAFLWPMPVSNLWGVGPRTVARLEGMGLGTIGDVARTSREILEEAIGTLGAHIWSLSNGIDDREVIPYRGIKSIGAEYTLEKDVVGREAILPHLRKSADRVGKRLRRKGLNASGVRVKLKTFRFKLMSRQMAIHQATDSTTSIMDAAVELLEQFDLSVPMRLIGLAVYDLGDVPAQQELFPDKGVEKNRRLDRALDAVQDKFGSASLTRAEEHEIRSKRTRSDD